MSIRDTSGQDTVVGTSGSRLRQRRPLVLGVIAGVALLLALAWLVSGWQAGSRSVSSSRLRISQVRRGDLVRDISADGRVIAANSPTLYAVAAGTVSLHVVAGDVVLRDQALAEIDSPDLRSRLAQEEATLASLEAEATRSALDAQLARSTASKQLDQAQIDRVAAQRDLERNERGFTGGAVPQIDVARAQDNLKKTEIGVTHARGDFALQSRGAGLDTRNKHLLADRQRAIVDELKRQVAALTLRAPFDGQVGQIQIAQRANVALNAPLLSVVDLSKFEVEIKVPESFARDLAIGMPAQLTSGSSEPYPGAVSAVSPEVVNGEVNARLRFSDKQPPGLRQNQRLSARIVLDTRPNVLMVERGPFVEQEGGHFAYVVDGGHAVRRPIRVGVTSLNAVEIIDGVHSGDRVVVSGSDLFADAPLVRISGE